MAAAVRMTAGPWSATAVAATGDFGRAVGDQLVAAGARYAPSGDPGTDRLVQILWRPAPEECDRIDEAAHAAGRPWLPIVAEHPFLVVGPWIVPGDGPCHRCYRMRRIQYDAQSAAVTALTDAYRADEAAGPGGFLPHHVRTAAGLAALACAGPAGRVHTVNLLTQRVTTSHVVGCHDCTRCGDGPIGRDGTVAAAVAALIRRPEEAR